MAVKLAVVAPAATVTDAGTVSEALLTESATVPPVVCDTVTVQVEVPPDCTVDGVHCSDETVVAGCVTVTVPPLPVIPRFVPSGNAAIALVIGIDSTLPVAAKETLTVATATTPLAIAVEFIPETRQRIAPALGAQLSDLLAAVNAGPADIVKEVISLDG